MNSIHDNIIIKRISDIINKINYIVNENKKNFQLIRNDITLLYNQMNKRFDELKINNKINNQEIKYKDGRYIGEVVNGLAEGKGIFYGYNGNRYEGEWRNDNNNSIMNKEIKYDDGKYVGQVVNGKMEGKGIRYWNDGDRYEGDYKNDKKEGKGIYYFKNGDREMGDWKYDKQIGTHATLYKNGEVNSKKYKY